MRRRGDKGRSSALGSQSRVAKGRDRTVAALPRPPHAQGPGAGRFSLQLFSNALRGNGGNSPHCVGMMADPPVVEAGETTTEFCWSIPLTPIPIDVTVCIMFSIF
jgi:hypothetical protein